MDHPALTNDPGCCVTMGRVAAVDGGFSLSLAGSCPALMNKKKPDSLRRVKTQLIVSIQAPESLSAGSVKYNLSVFV